MLKNGPIAGKYVYCPRGKLGECVNKAFLSLGSSHLQCHDGALDKLVENDNAQLIFKTCVRLQNKAASGDSGQSGYHTLVSLTKQ